MSTPTIDFSKYSAPPSTIDFSKYETPAQAPQPSVGQRLRENFASGLGVTDDEGAKNFFEHPINTLMKSLEAQGQLAIKAKDAYAKGDYKGAMMYGLNYLAPFIGQQTAKAGEQLNEGDIAGGIARTAGAALPLVAGSPEARAAAGNTAAAAAKVVKPVVAAVGERLPEIAGGATGAYLGHATGVPEGGLIGAIAGREFAKTIAKKFETLSDALGKSQQAHADVIDLDATEENKPYAGETARGRKLAAAPQAAPAAAGTSATPAQPAAAAPQFADRPRVTPSVQNIRERIAQASEAEAAPNRVTPDSLEDRAIQQEMNADLDRHGWAADSEARREFIARNSTGVTKSELTGAAEKPVRYTKTPGVPSPGTGADDLTDLLRKSLDAAKRAKEQR